METKRWMIENTRSGLHLGIYHGATEAEALDAMARDMGYADHAEACAVAPTEDGELVVRPAPATLDALLEWMRAHPEADWADVPSYGGDEPPHRGLRVVWSWDEERILCGACADELEIVRREDW